MLANYNSQNERNTTMSESLRELLNNEDIEGLDRYIDQLTSENSDLKKRVKELNEECEAQQYQFDILKKDPACVWANMLRGNIATPSALVEAHDYQQIKSDRDDLRAKLDFEFHNAAGLNSLCDFANKQLDECKSNLEQVKAKCAEMREALLACQDKVSNLHDSKCAYITSARRNYGRREPCSCGNCDLTGKITHALSASYGKGWRSPEDYAALEAKVKVLRALEESK